MIFNRKQSIFDKIGVLEAIKYGRKLTFFKAVLGVFCRGKGGVLKQQDLGLKREVLVIYITLKPLKMARKPGFLYR